MFDQPTGGGQSLIFGDNSLAADDTCEWTVVTVAGGILTLNHSFNTDLFLDFKEARYPESFSTKSWR